MTTLLLALLLATPKPACTAWRATEARHDNARPVVLGARCTEPPPKGLECPAIIWEVWAGRPGDTAEPASRATWEPDCDDNVGWEAPAARRYLLPEGMQWTGRVWFCGGGLQGAERGPAGASCKPGPRVYNDVILLVR